jgi:hypothetical protein
VTPCWPPIHRDGASPEGDRRRCELTRGLAANVGDSGRLRRLVVRNAVDTGPSGDDRDRNTFRSLSRPLHGHHLGGSSTTAWPVTSWAVSTAVACRELAWFALRDAYRPQL